MAEGEETEARGQEPDEGEKKQPIASAGDVRAVVVKEDLKPDKWALRKNWMRVGWMAFIVGFVFMWVWVGYEMQWGAGAVLAVTLLELPFFLVAVSAYLGIVRKRKRSRVVHVRKVSL
jgi:hypothetical protein